MTERRVRAKQWAAGGVEPWLSVDEIAEHLGVSRDTIYNWLKKGMPAHKFGKLWKFQTSEVDKWIKAGKAKHE